MAVAVIFGLFVSTLLTLVVVPVLCSLQDSMRNRVARFKARGKVQAADAADATDATDAA